MLLLFLVQKQYSLLLSPSIIHQSFEYLSHLFPWRRERLPTPIFWPGEFHGDSPWGRKESDATERLSLSLSPETIPLISSLVECNFSWQPFWRKAEEILLIPQRPGILKTFISLLTVGKRYSQGRQIGALTGAQDREEGKRTERPRGAGPAAWEPRWDAVSALSAAQMDEVSALSRVSWSLSRGALCHSMTRRVVRRMVAWAGWRRLPCCHRFGVNFLWLPLKNHRKGGGLKHQKFIFSQFWRPEIQHQFYWAKTNILAELIFLLEATGENPFSCFFWILQAVSLPCLVALYHLRLCSFASIIVSPCLILVLMFLS